MNRLVRVDAAAVLAYARGEPAAEVVGRMLRGGLISAVNFAEVLQKTVRHGGDAEAAARLLARAELVVVPFDERHARLAAAFWPAGRPLGLSLADRACLALGAAVFGTVYTADRQMARAEVPVPVILIRDDHG